MNETKQPVKFHPFGIQLTVDMQPQLSRVLHHFVWNSEGDTPANRKAFEHVTAYRITDDVTLLQTHGYVLEDA